MILVIIKLLFIVIEVIILSELYDILINIMEGKRMKLYRTVSQSELEDIKKYNRIRFQNPFWNFKSEGKIVNIFREINNLDNKNKTKNKIRKWVDAYIKSHKLKQEYLESNNKWYDFFTELSQIMYLFFTYYSKSFSRTKKEINTNRDEEDVAIIEIETEFKENFILKCEDENNKVYNLKKYENKKIYHLTKDIQGCNDAYIRHYPVKYNEICNYDTIFKEFNEERILRELLLTISSDYEWQEEERFFINIDTHKHLPTKGLNTLGAYISRKYPDKFCELKIYGNKESEEYYEDFIEALYEQFVCTYEEISENLPKYIYIYLPQKYIKITKIEK